MSYSVQINSCYNAYVAKIQQSTCFFPYRLGNCDRKGVPAGARGPRQWDKTSENITMACVLKFWIGQCRTLYDKKHSFSFVL